MNSCVTQILNLCAHHSTAHQALAARASATQSTRVSTRAVASLAMEMSRIADQELAACEAAEQEDSALIADLKARVAEAGRRVDAAEQRLERARQERDKLYEDGDTLEALLAGQEEEIKQRDNKIRAIQVGASAERDALLGTVREQAIAVRQLKRMVEGASKKEDGATYLSAGDGSPERSLENISEILK